MKKLFIFILLSTQLAYADEEKKHGSICVGPVDVHPKYMSESMEGRGRSAEYLIQIDSGTKKKLSEKSSILFEDLEPDKKHLVKVFYEGKLDQSFWHYFGEESEYCLWYKSLYFTWSIWPQSISHHLCKCTN